MRRISQSELEAMLYQALKAAPATAKTGLRSKLAMESDRAHEAMAKHIAARLSGDSTPVVRRYSVDNVISTSGPAYGAGMSRRRE